MIPSLIKKLILLKVVLSPFLRREIDLNDKDLITLRTKTC